MDLADQVEDYICSFQAIGDLEMDSLIMFVFLWLVAVLILLWLGKFLYQKYQNRKLEAMGSAGVAGTTSNGSATNVAAVTRTVPVIAVPSSTPIVKATSASRSAGLGGGRGMVST